MLHPLTPFLVPVNLQNWFNDDDDGDECKTKGHYCFEAFRLLLVWNDDYVIDCTRRTTVYCEAKLFFVNVYTKQYYDVGMSRENA